MQNLYCLNCGDTTEKKFCSNCGQKTDTHRLTPKHFFFHDIVHGVWHLDRGILFTLKEAIIRLGQAALDFIKWKRIKYYNVFYLSLLLIGLNLIIAKLFVKFNENANLEETGFEKVLSQNVKVFIFLFVPVFAYLSSWIFKKMKLNIAEHFIPAGITLLRILIINLIANILHIFYQSLFVSALIFPIAVLISIALVYYDFGRGYYSRGTIIFKSILLPLLALIFALLLILGGELIMRNL